MRTKERVKSGNVKPNKASTKPVKKNKIREEKPGKKNIQNKSLKKQIKVINSSLIYLTKDKQKELGVLSVQKDDGVFFCNDGSYKKIYMFKPATLGNKRAAFIKALTDRYNNRIRFSLCARNINNTVSSYMFMTVSFHADSYYDVRKKIVEFESSFLKDICAYLEIGISPCSIDTSLSFINMMISGEMKVYSSNILFQKKSPNLFLPLTDSKDGFFTVGKQQGVSFVGKNVLDPSEDVIRYINLLEGTYYFVVEIQGFTEEEVHLYNFSLDSKYCKRQEDDDSIHHINMSYYFTYLSHKSENVKSVYDKSFKWFDSKGIQIMPGIGCEKEVFFSDCTFGLTDFHNFQVSSPEIAGKLLF